MKSVGWIRDKACLFSEVLKTYARNMWATTKNALLNRIPLQDKVRCYERGSTLIVYNKHYIAQISKTNGELTSVFDRDSHGGQGGLALSLDQIRVRFYDYDPLIKSTDLNSSTRIEVEYDFYVKIASYYHLIMDNDSCWIERTYEFTRSPQIYEQVMFYINKIAKSGPLGPILKIKDLTWRVHGEREKVKPLATTDDLMVNYPLTLMAETRLMPNYLQKK